MPTTATPVLSTRQFTYVPEGHDFVAFASDLRWAPGRGSSSFVLVSSKTGREIVFRKTGTDFDRAENEIRGWTYRSVTDHFTATVFND